MLWDYGGIVFDEELSRRVRSEPRNQGQTSEDVIHAGSWIEGHQAVDSPCQIHADDNLEESIYLPGMPDTPVIGRLSTPNLSPLPSELEFCYCQEKGCSDCQELEGEESSQITDFFHISRETKTNRQCKLIFVILSRASWSYAASLSS